MKLFSAKNGIVLSILVLSVVIIIVCAQRLQLDTQIQNMLPKDEKLMRSVALTAGSSVSDKLLLYLHQEDPQKMDLLIDKANALIQEIGYLEPDIPNSQQINEIRLYLQKNAFILYPYEEFSDPFSLEEMQERLRKKFVYLQNMPFEDLGELFFSDPLNQISDLMKLQFSSSNVLSVYRDGVLSKDGTSFLRIFSTGYNSGETTKAAPLRTLDKKIIKIGQENGGESFLYGAHFYFMESSSRIQKEVSLICVISILLTVFVFFFFFSRISLIFYSFMPIVAGIALTFLTILIFCGKFGAIALGFGATVSGICIDYSIHYLFKAEFYGTLKELRQGIGKSLFMGYFTTLLAFLLLLFSRIDSLGEIALFGCLVITFSFLFNWFVLQHLLPPGNISYRVRNLSSGDRKVLFPRLRVPFLCVCFCLLIASFFTRLEINSSALDIPHKVLDERGQKIVREFGESTTNVFAGFPGKTKEEAIDAAMKATLAVYKEKPEFLFLNPAIFLPTENVIKNRIEHIRANFNRDRFFIAVDQSDFTREAFDSFFKMLDLLESGDFQVETRPAYLQSQTDDSIAEYEGMYYFMIHLGDRERAEKIYKCLDAQNVNYVPVDIMRDSVEGLKTFEQRALILIGAAVILIFVALLATFRNFRIALTSVLPIAAGLIGILGINAILGKPINIMHITSAILVVGIGVDYGIFSSTTWDLFRRKELTGEDWLRKRNRTVQSILAAALTTLASFGVLAISSSGALFSLGISMIFGIFCAFLMAILIVPLMYGDR